MHSYNQTNDSSIAATTERLFILGAPRSGTTFLASLLGTTRYGSPVESQFIAKYHALLPDYGDLSEFPRFNCLLNDILAERAVMQWRLQLDARNLHKQLLRNSHGVSYAELVDALFLARTGSQSRTAWGDKTPHYLDNVDVLDALFPNARYLYIVRDGRDVALSLLRKDWGPNNVYRAAEYWTRLNKKSATLERLQSTGRLHYLRYEDLSNNVAQHVRSIGTFLGESIAEDEIARLEKTVTKDNSYKWKQEFSIGQQQDFESVANETLTRFGYEAQKSINNISPVKRMGYRLHDRLVWLGFMFKTNVIHGFQIRFMGKEPFAD